MQTTPHRVRCSPTHKHTDTQTRRQTRTNTNTYKHRGARTHIDTHTQTSTHTQTPHTHTDSTQTHKDTHKDTETRRNKHTCTHTHTHVFRSGLTPSTNTSGQTLLTCCLENSRGSGSPGRAFLATKKPDFATPLRELGSRLIQRHFPQLMS